MLLFVGCHELPQRASTEALLSARALPIAAAESDAAPSARAVVSRGQSPRAEVTRVAATDEDEGHESDVTNETWFPAKTFRQQPARSGRRAPGGPGFARGIASTIDESPPLFSTGEAESRTPLSPVTDDDGAASEMTDPSCSEIDEAGTGAAEPMTISFKDDLKQLPWMLWNDNKSLYTWSNAVVLGVAAGGAVATRDNLDQRVRHETAEHPLRWGQGSVVLRQFGEFAYQVPVLAGVYGVSVWTENDKLHEFSKAAISAYSLSALYTVAIKGVTNTSRPTNEFQHGRYGFPSYHASSTFSLAAVIDEYYGWQAGIPAYVLAGLVGWTRIDQREHDLSDVLFGSVLGFVVGKTVAAAHLERYSGFRVTPYYDAGSRTSGVTVDTKF